MDNLEEMNLVELGNKETKNVNGGNVMITYLVWSYYQENSGAFLPPLEVPK